MTRIELILLVIGAFFTASTSNAQSVTKGDILYSNSLSNTDSLADWKMEGSATVSAADGWMEMFSPDQKDHHVFWCPMEFPADFVAEWELRNLNPASGLCIVFFAAKGVNGEDIFDSKLKHRNGIFKQYTNGDISNYHISYYANTPTQKDRPFSHLRKNPGFHKVHVGKSGIPANSESTHKITLIKNNNHIQMLLDGSVIIDWLDDGKELGAVLGSGKIGFRQMKWTHFAYRNFRVWELSK
ncbi:MAG: YesU family protein [Flavobacteriales bacterium]|nr:YesU family protein [Flavobacteriales bacterium]